MTTDLVSENQLPALRTTPLTASVAMKDGMRSRVDAHNHPRKPAMTPPITANGIAKMPKRQVDGEDATGHGGHGLYGQINSADHDDQRNAKDRGNSVMVSAVTSNIVSSREERAIVKSYEQDENDQHDQRQPVCNQLPRFHLHVTPCGLQDQPARLVARCSFKVAVTSPSRITRTRFDGPDHLLQRIAEEDDGRSPAVMSRMSSSASSLAPTSIPRVG